MDGVADDDIEFAAAAAVPITSVRRPALQIGRTCAGLLITEAEEGAAHRHEHVVHQPELVVRASSLLRGTARGRELARSGAGRRPG